MCVLAGRFDLIDLFFPQSTHALLESFCLQRFFFSLSFLFLIFFFNSYYSGRKEPYSPSHDGSYPGQGSSNPGQKAVGQEEKGSAPAPSPPLTLRGKLK